MQACVGAIRLGPSKQLDEASERALVDRCRRSDLEAFGKLIDAYQARVHGFVRRMVPPVEDAADLTQEVFIRAFQNLHRFDGRCSIRTWLFRIAYNLCVDRSRRIERMPATSDLYAGVDQEEPIEFADERWEPESIVLDDELAALVESGIASMSEKLRSVLVLHDREDMSYEEIAQTLNVPIGTVKSRLFLARAHLQAVLSPYLRSEVASV